MYRISVTVGIIPRQNILWPYPTSTFPVKVFYNYFNFLCDPNFRTDDLHSILDKTRRKTTDINRRD